MSTATAADSLRFALQGEMVKLYLVVVVGFWLLQIVQSPFFLHQFTIGPVRGLLSFALTLVAWSLVAGGAFGALHFVLTQREIATTGA